MHSHPPPFLPDTVFGTSNRTPPQVFAAPSRYIQGDGVLAELGRYLSVMVASVSMPVNALPIDWV